MKGVLLVNLGSPDSTKTSDVRRYLDEFLMDKRVIDIPYLLRVLLVRGIILNTRPKKSASAYKKIWTKEGSPLIVLSEKLRQKVQSKATIPISLAMRYGKPSIKSGLEELYKGGVRDVLLIPLYPQFAMATTETILVLAQKLRKKYFTDLRITHVPAFYNKEDYIKVLSSSIEQHIKNNDFEHLLFSYHGVPERHIRKSDVTKSHCKIDEYCCVNHSDAHEFCYRHQCYQTTRQVADFMGLKEEQYSTSFQSRLGSDPWLQPYTDDTIKKIAEQKTKKLAVVTPAFVSDCLETLEEIGMEGKEIFLEAGGEKFQTIPCLNDSQEWANTLADWIKNWQNSSTLNP